jgi:hypothetical protein
MKTPEIVLREWTHQDFLTQRQKTKEVQQIAGKAGTGSDGFKSACENLLKYALASNSKGVVKAVQRSIDVRALSYLVANSKDFNSRLDLDTEMLNVIVKVTPKMGTISLLQLIRAFFLHFDQLGTTEVIDHLANLIANQLSTRAASDADSDISRFKQNANALFTRKGPFNVVNHAIKKGDDLNVQFLKLALNGYAGGRFQKLCYYRYYIEQIERVLPGEDESLQNQLSHEDVYMAPGEEGELLGHSILRKIIDGLPDSEIPDSWQRIILTIAKDPRVSSTSEDYQRWWIPLGSVRIQKVRGWLSRFDLRLFLEVLKATANQSGSGAQQRMFKTRKRFMEGLLALKLISDSRLFLGTRATNYLRNNYEPEELSSFAENSSKDTSVLYLNIGGYHLIEGTHSFTVKLMEKIPDKLSLLNYGKTYFSDSSFRTNIKYWYINQFGSTEGYLEATHDIHLNWQHKLINFLHGRGIKIPPEQVLTKEQYRKYKNKFGIRI